MIAPRLVDYLIEHGADRAPHARGLSLLDHLLGTHALLAKWRADEDVRLAGLFHSVYGTSIYRRRSVPLRERQVVAALIGKGAEHLAFLFCVADRPRVWHGNLRQLSPRLATVGGDSLAVARRDLGGLIEIECANLLEQRGGRGSLEKLAALIRAERGLVSPACRRAVLHAVHGARPRTPSAGRSRRRPAAGAGSGPRRTASPRSS